MAHPTGPVQGGERRGFRGPATKAHKSVQQLLTESGPFIFPQAPSPADESQANADRILGRLELQPSDLPPALPTSFGQGGAGAGAPAAGLDGLQGLFGTNFQRQLQFMQSPQGSQGNLNFTIPNIKTGSKRGGATGGANGQA